MQESEETPQVILRIGERVYYALHQTVDDQLNLADSDGLPRVIALQGVLNALVKISASTIHSLVSPGSAPNFQGEQEIHASLTAAVHHILIAELEGVKPTEDPHWSGPQEGHA